MQPDDTMEIGGDVQEGLVRAFEIGEVEGVPGPVERIDTHLNHIFLSADRAFKLKRAVRLPFVDFTSIEQRRAACVAELTTNTMLGSPFYLGVEPVVRGSNGVYRLGGSGSAEDWVVVMRQFDRSRQLDVLARSGVLTIEDIEQTAHSIAALHARAPANQLAGHVADYRHVVRTLKQTEAEAASGLGLHAAAEALYDRLDAELARIGPLIERRRAAGKVRRTHGDLHLRNICMIEGKATPFDALEFDERMATTDVLYDLAFLLMDLRCCGLMRHANAAMNRYWDETQEDEEALQLLPFFMSLRATVRLAVSVAEGKLEEAQDYRLLALELLGHVAPVFIAIGGLSGTGKTAVASDLAQRLPGPAGARLLRSDVLRKRVLGVGFTQHAGHDAYAPERRAEVYRDLASRAAAAVSAGVSTIADATFRMASARDAIGAAVPNFSGFWLHAPTHVRLEKSRDAKETPRTPTRRSRGRKKSLPT